MGNFLIFVSIHELVKKKTMENSHVIRRDQVSHHEYGFEILIETQVSIIFILRC